MQSFWMFCNNWFFTNNVLVFKSFWLISNYFRIFYWFCVFLSYIWLIVFFDIGRILYFFYYLLIRLHAITNLSSQMFHWIITSFFSKSNSFAIVFKDKISEFIDFHLFYSACDILDIHYYTRKTKKVKQKA